VKVYANDDDALLFWRVPAAIAGCRGFAIERRKTDPDGTVTDTFLPNRVGFAAGQAPAAGQDVSHTRPSTEWPFQRFSWTDHDADVGDTVSYRVIPIIRDDQGVLVQLVGQASPFSPEVTLGAPTGSGFAPFFNRGFVISQFMARYLAEKQLTPAQFKAHIQDEDEQVIRGFLAGNLRRAMLNELFAARDDDNAEIFAALFELADDELINALSALGPRAHVVLANGSISAAKGETTAEARTRDENNEARIKLINAGVDVASRDRFTAPKPLGHNKFLIRTRADEPIAAWTGSTNWTPTGLCTQLNNGLLIRDPAVATVYLDQWHRLREAASSFPATLTATNSTPTTIATAGGGGGGEGGGSKVTVWFSRTRNKVDLAALRAEVAAASSGILFLMFMPGATGLLPDVLARNSEAGMYVRGVVSELPRGRGDESQVKVDLVDGTRQQSARLQVISPEGIAHPFANFAAEVTHKQFLASIGHAIIHSKVLVIDPFTPTPTVITGSHNFSTSASTSNDENFLIIKYDPALAQAYAVNIMAAYDHYRWRAFLGQAATPFNGLRDDDTWMAPKLTNSRRDLDFWIRS
jgi:phosphatidylserine/phosphatidylglycerophosphate/cardiolipin synthase-like enzyme